jgi:carbon starvation protein CstA
MIPLWLNQMLFVLVTSIAVLVEGVYLAAAGYNWGALAVVLTIMTALAIGWMLTNWSGNGATANVVSSKRAHFLDL